MSDIEIEKDHNLSVEKCKEMIKEMAGDIATKYKGKYKFNGDNLTFTAPGINGNIRLTHNKMYFDAKLGFLMRPLKSAIEKQVHEKFDLAMQNHKNKNKVKM